LCSPEGEVVPCVGVCLGLGLYSRDIVTLSSDLLLTDLPEIVTSIHDIRWAANTINIFGGYKNKIDKRIFMSTFDIQIWHIKIHCITYFTTR
jgi:hypothetical protein